MRNPEWCRKLVPKMRWSISEGAVWVIRFDQSDMRWRRVLWPWGGWIDRYKVIQIRRLRSENFVSERDDIVFNSFRNFKPVKRFQNRSDVLKFWSTDNSSSKSILIVLETIYLKFRELNSLFVALSLLLVMTGFFDHSSNCMCNFSCNWIKY